MFAESWVELFLDQAAMATVTAVCEEVLQGHLGGGAIHVRQR